MLTIIMHFGKICHFYSLKLFNDTFFSADENVFLDFFITFSFKLGYF